MGSKRILGMALLLALAAPLAFRAQVTTQPRPKPAPKQEAAGRANIRVDTTLILVPVTVNDPLNRPVSGLERENFRVFEDKLPQAITQFAMDDEPVAVCLVFDTSGSMGDKLKRSRAAAQEFFRIANPEDEFCLVEFDSAPTLRVPITSDTGSIENELLFSKSHGSTALLDAVYLALHEMKLLCCWLSKRLLNHFFRNCTDIRFFWHTNHRSDFKRLLKTLRSKQPLCRIIFLFTQIFNVAPKQGKR